MKVVYLIDQAFDERNYDRFGIETWQRRGWAIEVWDITQLAHPAVWQGFIESGRPIRPFTGYIQIGSVAHLRQLLSSGASVDCFVDFGGESTAAVWAKIRLARQGAIRIICAVGSAPEGETAASTPGLGNKVRRALHYGFVRTLKWGGGFVLNRLAAALAPPDLVVASGAESLRRFARWAGRETIHAHNLDYDLYLRLQAQTAADRPPYALFVDQDLCFHPDYTYDEIPVYVTQDQYFPAMRKGLERLAAQLGVAVRVAAHPRSSYEQRVDSFFGPVTIERGVTSELIRDCRCVVGHFSVVLQMAVLFGKPIIFFTTNQLRRSAMGSSVDRFASELGKSVINLDENLDRVDWEQELVVDAEKYAAFRHRHIKMDGSPDRPHWEIVMDWLEPRIQVKS